MGRQTLLAWSPDGTRLLYSDEDKLFLTDPAVAGHSRSTPAARRRHRRRRCPASTTRGRILQRWPQHRLRPDLHRCGRVDRSGGARHHGSRERPGVHPECDRGCRRGASGLVSGRAPDRVLQARRQGQRWPGPGREGRGVRHRRGWPEPAPDQRAVDGRPVRRMVARRRPDRLRVSKRRARGRLHDATRRVRRAAVDNGRVVVLRRRGCPMGGSCSPALPVVPGARPRAGGR